MAANNCLQSHADLGCCEPGLGPLVHPDVARAILAEEDLLELWFGQSIGNLGNTATAPTAAGNDPNTPTPAHSTVNL